MGGGCSGGQKRGKKGRNWETKSSRRGGAGRREEEGQSTRGPAARRDGTPHRPTAQWRVRQAARPAGGLCLIHHIIRGVKNVFSVFFLESNTDRNTRIFLAVAVAYFAYFGSSFRIPVFGGFVSSVLDSAGHAAAACHAHVPPPRSPAAAGATPRPLCCVQLLPPVPPNRADRQSGTHRKSARDRARELWQWREWRRSGRINCHFKKKRHRRCALKPRRRVKAAARSSR